MRDGHQDEEERNQAKTESRQHGCRTVSGKRGHGTAERRYCPIRPFLANRLMGSKQIRAGLLRALPCGVLHCAIDSAQERHALCRYEVVRDHPHEVDAAR